MIEFLPCPFCGEQPRLSRRMDEDLATHNIVEWVNVSCHDCDVGFDIPDGYDGGTSSERWNRRASVAQTSAMTPQGALEIAANIAESIDSGRGNEKEIARAIRRVAKQGYWTRDDYRLAGIAPPDSSTDQREGGK